MFDPKDSKYQKHIFAHIYLMLIQLIVFILLSIAISVENPRVGGSIPPSGNTLLRRSMKNFWEFNGTKISRDLLFLYTIYL